MEEKDIKGAGGGGGEGLADGAEQVLRHVRAISDEVTGLAGAVSSLVETARSKIDVERRLREQPVKTMLIAAGVGYLAGGGFFTPFTGRLMRVGARLWLIPALKNQLVNRQEYH